MIMKRKRERQSSPEQQKVEEQTQPLPPLSPLAFERFLTRHRLSILDVASAARVRMMTVWRVAHDYPISIDQAAQVRLGLYHLTGVSYRGRIRLYVGESISYPTSSHE
jgi:hypothetical protein